MCTRIYDFINGTDTVLAIPRGDATARPRFDILHPGVEAEKLIARHLDRLASLNRPQARAGMSCGR